MYRQAPIPQAKLDIKRFLALLQNTRLGLLQKTKAHFTCPCFNSEDAKKSFIRW
jgi:hypothetical protein